MRCVAADVSATLSTGISQLIEGGEVAQVQAQHLRQAGRNAIRAVKLDGVGRSEMQAVQTLRSESMQRFLRYMRELHEQTYFHLQTSVEEETQTHEQKDEFESNLKMNTMNIMTTSHELERERENRQKHVATRDEQIKKLRKEIDDIQTTTAADKKRIETQTKEQETSLETSFNDLEKKMLKQLEGLTKTYDELCAENWNEKERELRRQKKVREEKVGQVLNEYDGFMEQMEADMNALTAKFNQETEDLARYEKDYKDVMAWKEERNRREEAERAEEERKRREEKRRYDSATLIQQCWHKCLERRAAAKKGKKKKKK